MNGQEYTFYNTEEVTAVLAEGEQYLETRPTFDSFSPPEGNYDLRLRTQVEAISWRPQDTATDKELRERFNYLAEIWERETRFISSISDIILHPAHLKIVGMGPEAVPLILNRMEEKAGLWFWALNFISGYDPVTKEIRGNAEAIRAAWLDWGWKNGFC